MESRVFYQYRPRTAEPFLKNSSYQEILPEPALRPYIRCFTGSMEGSVKWVEPMKKPSVIIPDTCMDLFLEWDEEGRWESSFVGINDSPFLLPGGEQGEQVCFSIRFHAWAVCLFAENDMTQVKNCFCGGEEYFSSLERELRFALPKTETLSQRVEQAQKILRKHLRIDRENAAVMNSFARLLETEGRENTRELARFACVSPRQLERLYKQYIGLSPKKVSGLVRYQCLWQALVEDPALTTMEAALRFGYHDQAHLLHEFKKNHTMTPAQAKEFAFSKG